MWRAGAQNGNISETRKDKEGSWAIAKMTVQCALYISALKIFCSTWLCPLPTPTFPAIFNGVFFRCHEHAIKFEVRSFSCSRDNWGYPNNWGSLCSLHGYAHALFLQNFNGLLFRWTCERAGQIWSPFKVVLLYSLYGVTRRQVGLYYFFLNRPFPFFTCRSAGPP